MPTDTAFLSTLTVKRRGKRSDTTFYAFQGKTLVGWVSVFVPSAVSEDLDTFNPDDDDWYVDCVDVMAQFRRKGVATFLYKHMEKVFGYIPSVVTSMTADGRAFHKALNDMVNRDYAAAATQSAA